MAKKKYIVALEQEERKELESITTNCWGDKIARRQT
jgi:hypothetical protein